MDDIEDLIKLNNVLKSEGAHTSRAYVDVLDLEEEESFPINNLCLQDVKDVALTGDMKYLHQTVEIDYTEEIERDAKEAERIILQKLENIVSSGLNIPECVTKSLISFEQDDLEVIEKCNSDELKRLMLLNRTKRAHLVTTLKKILELLNTTNKILWEQEKEETPKLKWSSFKSDSSYLGAPYFKLRNNKISCWTNPDVKRKRLNNELMLNRVMPYSKWTTKDKLLLKKFVAVFYSYAREKELQEKIKSLENLRENATDPKDIKNYNNEIKKIKKKISELRKSENDVYPELNSNDDIDWFEISEQLKGRHSASECKAYWNMFLHPDRKEDKWTKSDDSKLLEVAKKYKYQNWEKIAEEVGLQRSAYSLCSRYFSKLCTEYCRRDRFHPDEDELLLDIIETCRIGNYVPWSKVSYYFNGRTKHQLYHRYTYFLSRKNLRKIAPFSFEEDALIMALVDRMGKNFPKIAQYVPDRSSMQIKNRYNCYLENPDLTYRPFSIDEDRQILIYGAEHNGTDWGVLAKMINLPRSNVRHRYKTLSNWVANNPDKDLSEVPRRYISNANELNAKFHQLKNITNTLRNLKSIPTLEDVKNCMSKRKLNSKRPSSFLHNTIHQQLINYFKTSFKISRACSFVSDVSTEKDAQIINDILHVLGAELDLPDRNEIKVDHNIDKMDVFFLKHIANKRSTDNRVNDPCNSLSVQNSIKWALPPNISTVVGLRNMILTMSLNKNKPILRDPVDYNELIEQYLAGLPEIERTHVLKDRTKFQQRLYATFRWPSLMSLTDVGDLKSTCTDLTDGPVPLQPKQDRPRGRPRKDNAKMSIKVKKMLEAKEKKKREQEAKLNSSKSDYISIKEFTIVNCSSDLENVTNSSTQGCSTSNSINVGASTSRSDDSLVFNIPSPESMFVKKTNNARTYKRKREPLQKIPSTEDLCVNKTDSNRTYRTKRIKTEISDEKPLQTDCLLVDEIKQCPEE